MTERSIVGSTGERLSESQSAERLALKNRFLALLLSWLFPGAGHLYQGRYLKAFLFAVSIWSLLISGLIMGSYRAPLEEGGAPHLFFARDVYCSWRAGDKRLYFIPQSFIGAIALPAYFQAKNPTDATESFWSTAFAPPRLSGDENRGRQPSGDELIQRLGGWFDLGSLYTLVAGLLNLMAIFDAVAGPAPATVESNEEETKEEKKE